MNGNNWIGKAKIINTPMGNIVKNMLEENIEFAISSRGLGSLKRQNDADYVCEDYQLITPGDLVSDPSGPDCFVTAIMENKEWVWVNGKLYEKEDQIKNFINKNSDFNEKKLLEIFEYILTQIK